MSDTAVTHIERPGTNFDDPIPFVRMLCGASCVILDRGETVPALDFYMLGRGDEKASCPACRTARSLDPVLERETADT